MVMPGPSSSDVVVITGFFGASQPHGSCDGKSNETLPLIDRGAAGYEVLMGGEASAALRLKHVVDKHVLLRNIPVRLYLRVLDVLIRTRSRLACAVAAEAFQFESIHFSAVVVAHVSLPGMAEIAGLREVCGAQLDRSAMRAQAGRGSVGPREGCEEIVEAAVLLDDQDDVLDVRGTRAPKRGGKHTVAGAGVNAAGTAG